MKRSTKTAPLTQVHKEYEYSIFLGLVSEGAWKNDSYLARVCNVDRDTIAKWKLQPEVIKINQELNKNLLSRWKRIGKVEDLLKEQDMQFDPDKTETKITIEISNLDDV